MYSSIVDRRWLLAALAGFSALVAVLYSLVAAPGALEAALSENGPVEMVSALLHFATAALAVFLLIRLRRLRGILGLIAVTAFLFGGRELDWHKAFTTHGIFSTKLYAYDTVPLAEKLIGGGVVLTLLVLLVISAIAARHDLRRLRAAASPAIVGMITLLIYLPVIKLIDGAPRMMTDAGMTLSDGAVRALLAIEEIGEMALPIMMALLVVQIVRTPAPPFATVTVTYIGRSHSQGARP